MSVGITMMVSDSDAQRILLALGYRSQAEDGSLGVFVKAKLSEHLKRMVMEYELRNNITSLTVT